jgi:hypothetical protein
VRRAVISSSGSPNPDRRVRGAWVWMPGRARFGSGCAVALRRSPR